MKNLKLVFGFAAMLFATSTSAQEKVMIGGSGSLREPMKELAQVYMAKKSSDVIEVLEEHLGSSGGIEATKAGRLSIGLVSRPPRENEKGSLLYRPLARTPVIVAANKGANIANLSEAQVCDIYSGRVKSWKEVGGADVKVVVLMRSKDDANFEGMKNKLPCLKETKITSEAIPLNRSGELQDALERRTGTVGIINFGIERKEHPTIKVVSIGGIETTLEAVYQGKYPYYYENGIVTLGEPKGAAKRFLDFIGSAEGKKILAKSDIVFVR